MRIKKQIPNVLTLLNLLCGMLACGAILNFDLDRAFAWFIGCLLFDFSDGFVARLLKVSSPIGKELDSLSDMVSFGLAPGFLLYHYMPYTYSHHGGAWVVEFYRFLTLLIPIFSALRLAKFNTDERQGHSFIGLPTPANAMFWLSAGWGGWLGSAWISQELIIVAVFISSYLLVCELPMFSLKLKGYEWEKGKGVYKFLIFCVLILVFFKKLGLALCILSYIFVCLFQWFSVRMQEKDKVKKS